MAINKLRTNSRQTRAGTTTTSAWPVAAPPPPRESAQSVSIRIMRNAAWLLCSEGLTKSLFVAANIILARMLSAADYGTLTLAQSWVIYAAMVMDLGIMMYGQAEAARRTDRAATAALARELMPLRALLGALVFIALLGLFPLFTSSRPLRLTMCAASLYLVAQALSAEWLFRGKERFSVVLIANGTGAALFLAGIAAIAALRSDTLVNAALAWSFSAFAMAAVYLAFLPGLVGLPRSLRIAISFWRRHARESSFFALSNVISESYRLLPFFLLGFLASAREVGLFAAPLRLVVNAASLGFLVPMAFYPASARLFRERPALFAESRRTLVMTMLVLGVPSAVIGMRVAAPIVTLIFGEPYRESAKILAVLVWLLPLYFVRYVYGATILATGFQRLHTIASGAAAVVALLTGIPLVRYFGATGAAVSLIAAEIAMGAAMIAIAARVHHEASIPEARKLIRLGILTAAMWLCGFCCEGVLGPLPSAFLLSALLMIATYIIGLSVLGLADWQGLLQRYASRGVFRVRPSESN
jgi:O-antigen/teichoic acid export membrane protein